jgi:MurNAc alpha-1-phosphate uridylyltransferase
MTDGSLAPALPDTAMILAAGRGSRLGAASDLLPKPLMDVGGRPLIDHALDMLSAAGVRRFVVNTHHLAERIERHLARRRDLDIAISREATLLDTGGGVRNALPLLARPVFLAVNADLVWDPDAGRTLKRMAALWDAAAMDALLLLFPTVRSFGYEGLGDFFCDPLGQVRRRREREVAPFLYTGAQILHRRAFDGTPDGPFSMRLVWERAEAAGRLYGLVHDGEWLDAGTPARLAHARAELGDLAQGRLL